MSKKIDKLRGLMDASPAAITAKGEPVAELRTFGDSRGKLFTVDASRWRMSLSDWTLDHREFLETAFQRHRAILFRGFQLDEKAFADVVTKWSTDILDYTEPSTPRSKVMDKVYTSTEYPRDQSIPLHNEHSYTSEWPRKIWFYCSQPAARAGETPIADSHEVFERIDAGVRQKFLQKQVLYLRNYSDDLDLRWQTVFQTESRADVEAYCSRRGIEWKWNPDGTLQTLARRPAVVTHPETGEMLWFNQAHLFHVSNLPAAVREYLLSIYGEANLPRNAFYGDGSPIEEAALDDIRRAYRESSITFPWEPADLLMLDNMRFAHGRNPFDGDRRVLVAMAEQYSVSDVKGKDRDHEAFAGAAAQARQQTSTFWVRQQAPDSAQALKYKFAGLFRILAMEGMEEGISGHASLRVPGKPDCFWVNPFGLMFEEVTPDNILMVDHKANVLEGRHPVNVAGFCIHAAIHAARPDVQCVAHTHSPWGTAFASLGKQIEPLDQNCCMFFESHAVLHEYHGPVNDAEEAARLEPIVRKADTLILQNHGTITLGQDIESAAIRMLAAERAYRLHLRVIGQQPVLVPDEVARSTREWIANPIGLKIEFDAYLRKAERRYPDLLGFREIS